ncbi:hypothetical protein JCM33374_g4730 [Metschnikowia sp. JCM 33374]|nr:hypothetical protein JCM33374_g4730 [Metschnikowia sp. JCM 33374]
MPPAINTSGGWSDAQTSWCVEILVSGALRKGEKGLVVIAGDIPPADVISHIPVLGEGSSVPFVFIPSKEDWGSAGATKRPISCVLIAPGGGKPKKNAEKVDEMAYKSPSRHSYR